MLTIREMNSTSSIETTIVQMINNVSIPAVILASAFAFCLVCLMLLICHRACRREQRFKINLENYRVKAKETSRLSDKTPLAQTHTLDSENMETIELGEVPKEEVDEFLVGIQHEINNK